MSKPKPGKRTAEEIALISALGPYMKGAKSALNVAWEIVLESGDGGAAFMDANDRKIFEMSLDTLWDLLDALDTALFEDADDD